MEELQARHRKELRDLQSQITQKKKSASKKTRKSVNDECTKLEQDLKERQAKEIADVDGQPGNVLSDDPQKLETANDGEDDDLLASIAGLSTKADDQKSAQDGDNAQDAAGAQSRKPNRQKARLARRAAEQEEAAAQAADEAANLPDLKAKERERMLNSIATHGLLEQEVAANGHCLYLSMADQIKQLKLSIDDTLLPARLEAPENQDDFKTVRRAAANYISANPDDFAAFVEEPLPDYITKIRDTGEWGGELELLALAKSYAIDINVLQGDTSIVKIESGADKTRGTAWLAYYRHGFGLGEHYNSLRKKQSAKKAE